MRRLLGVDSIWRKMGLVGLEFAGWVGRARNVGDGLRFLLNKAFSFFPGRNPRPRALMDLGTNGTQSEMASNTQL